MIIWQGWGPISFVILMMNWAFSFVMCEYFWGTLWAKDHELKIVAFALIVTAICTWFLGRWLNKKPGRLLVDPKTEEKVVLKERHSLYGVPMEWTSIIYLAIALGIIFYN